MKVTVCFGAIKVIVPCGEGNLSVGELIEKSVQRYKKATGRSPDYWVQVHSLASQSEGGILDVDDVVSDVADDREKLTAHFEEQDPSRAQVVSNHLGDGTSTCASSVGTASPINFSDMNHINNSNNKTHHMHHTHHHINGTLEEDNEMDVVVTGKESDSKLVVRRGSDPVITSMLSKSEVNGENAVMDKNANTLPAKTSSTDKPRSRRGSRDELSSAFSRFGRDSAGSARQSLSSAHPSMNKWSDAQQKAESKVSSERGPDVMIEGDGEAEMDSIVLTNDGTPLGVHIISKIEQEDGSAFGIVVHNIEAGGRAARDGRLRPGDYIVQINGSDISLHSFNRAQEMLRDAMRNPTVKLTVQRDKFFSSQAAVGATTPTTPRENGHLEITIPPKSPGGKVPPVVPVRSPTTALSSPTATGDKSSSAKLIPPMSTRRIGRKLYIQLMKGPQGLGFSVTSRDNPTGGKNPIFIKNILPKGAAISDGRLKPGDRLMEVNGIEMTGKSQSEAVSILRSVKLGGVVNLVVSRQDSPVKMVPRQLPEDGSPVEESVTSPKNRAVMTFEIPLNDTGSAGLGVSVKGKTSGATEEQSSKDLGIFIKSVIHGGAASKDGRLRPNDQLLCINDTSLANMSNSEAMETLRLAMSHEKSPRSTISLVIARRLDQQDPNAHTNNLNKGATSPAADRNVDSGLLSPLPPKDGTFGMPNSLSDGVLSSRTTNGGMNRNEIVVHASVEPHHATSPRHQGAKVTYPGSTEQPIYSRTRKSSSGQTLPSSSSGAETAMQADDSSPADRPMHLSIHSSPSARAPSPPQWLLDWENGAKDGELSPLPDPDNFARDNYARASFSERRQGGSLDAKQMAWYKKTKGETPKKQTSAQKDVAASTSSLIRASSMDSLLDSKPSTSRVEETSSKTMGPGLGMEKSSSLESLQVAVAHVHQQREDFPGRPRAKVRRGRVCNDSFRAAVDRSYGDQSPNGEMASMYTVMEAEENGGYGISRSSGGGDDGIQSGESMKKKKDKKEDKGKTKSSGTGFKGLFGFGKNRKSIGSENALKGKDKDSNKNQMSETERLEQEEMEKRKARQQAKQEHEKIQEEIQKMREAKIKEENQEALSKADRMMQLRQQYQQRHRDNQGQYMDDGDDDDDDYTRVDPNSHQETMSQRERLEAARAEQRERDRQGGRVPERDRYERLPPEAEDRRKDRRDDIYSEPKDRRDDRTVNNRYSDDPYADPRNLRNSQDRGRDRYYDDKYGRRNDRDMDENPYDRYSGKKDHGAQESRDGRYDRNRDNRSSDPQRQERRRSLKRTDRVENAKNRADTRSQGKENINVDRQEKQEIDEKGRERRSNERRAEYRTRSDKSIERRNPKREEQRQDVRRDDRYKDSRYDGRREERYPEREGDDRYDPRDNRYESRRDDRYYDDGGRRPEDRRDRQPPRDERHDKYPDQRDRYRNVQQDDRHGYGSLDRPSRRPRGKDPNYYSMSDNVGGSVPDDDYARTQNYSRYNYNDQPRRTSYPNGPVPNHVSHTSGPSGDRYRRANSTSDYLEYRDEPRRSKSISDQLADEYQYDSRRAGPRKGHQRSNDMGDGRMYNDYDDAARV